MPNFKLEVRHKVRKTVEKLSILGKNRLYICA